MKSSEERDVTLKLDMHACPKEMRKKTRERLLRTMYSVRKVAVGRWKTKGDVQAFGRFAEVGRENEETPEEATIRTSVLASRSFTVDDGAAIMRPADDLVPEAKSARCWATRKGGYSPDTGKILCTPTTNDDDGVVLKVVPLAHDVRLRGLARAQADTRDLTLAGVGLLRLADEDLRHDALPLGRALEQRRRRADALLRLGLALDGLVERDASGRGHGERSCGQRGREYR
jgi:hypothetical protein